MQADGKVLLYWGCSATVAKGWPEVIDFKSLGSRVPPEVAAMVMGEIVGPTRGFAYPPQKPGEKKPPIWTAKVRLAGFDSVMLGMGDAVKDGASESAADSVVPGGGGLMKAVKGLFGK